jgi:hypothetical protein
MRLPFFQRVFGEPAGGTGHPSRVLFLDDDPIRASIFLEDYPEAVWVQTAEECIARLAECWDEIHLDHDLGGEVFVDMERDDCGMAVVRWLCLEPRPHLKRARFFVHSHNASASWMMVMQMLTSGFLAEGRPFGAPPPPPPPPPGLRGRWQALREWLGRIRHERYGPRSWGPAAGPDPDAD